MSIATRVAAVAAAMITALAACATSEQDSAVVRACLDTAKDGLREIAEDRAKRFQGKVEEFRARCRGGERAVAHRDTPWVDWANYWAAADASSRSEDHDEGSHIRNRNIRGIDGALMDFEYQRMELIKFNLFDNKTFETYLTGFTRPGPSDGATAKIWPEMRLPADHPQIGAMKIAPDGSQICTGALIRHRTLTGICNDIHNPAMGSTGQLLARNVQFEATFPGLEKDQYAKNRHGGRLSLLKPDPQVVSRKLFTRDQSGGSSCNEGRGRNGSKDADCAYLKAPFFNVLAAFWIQFMTHDWFSHIDEGRNDRSRIMTNLGCATQRVGNAERPLSRAERARLGCRTTDKMEAALVAQDDDPARFRHDGQERLTRAYKTFRNNVTAWWDASQIYGYDETSARRARRDPADPAKLLMVRLDGRQGEGERYGYLPVFRAPCAAGQTEGCDPINREWVGQESVAFPDNWTIGLSFFHNVFVREHNIIVDEFRKLAKMQPGEDSGLRNPDRPSQVITYSQVTDEELFQVARLIVAAQIAKIHTTEWTTQLLYDEPGYIAMNSNWHGLFERYELISEVIERLVLKLRESPDSKRSNLLYSAFAAGPGIFGLGNHKFPTLFHRWFGIDEWNLSDPDDVNGGTNHFGSPFNFTEEFVTVYRLHAMVPDLLEYREWGDDPNVIRRKDAVVETFRAGATSAMRERGIANWALSMGRQRLGRLSLLNVPQFLQNLDLRPRLDTKIDIAALDIIRDREHGLPGFNEFRRQLGLRQLTSFDDFIDRRLPEGSEEKAWQRKVVQLLREVYGQHRCDVSKVITTAQLDREGKPINDCLGHADGAMVDNIEDVDIVVGFLAESTRPHGFAISETQFHIFILNASRRLYSDRFYTSSFRPEFYTHFGIKWVMENGPTGVQWEKGLPNGHQQQVLPLKRILLRAMPELEPELRHVINAFDPWARDRGEYYALEWRPRPDASADEAFRAGR